MKVALCSAVWGRVPLSRVWYRGLNRMRHNFWLQDITARSFVAGSESAQYQLISQYEHAEWIEAPNNALGEKWNKTVRAALAWGADYIFILGSDDFFCDRMVAEYARLAKAGVDYAAMRTIYMYEPASDRAMLFDNAKRLKATIENLPPDGSVQIIYLGESAKDPAKTTVGAGRLIHRKFFEGHENFWEPSKRSALDASMTKLLGLPEAHIVSSDIGIALDVKTEANIWKLDDLIEWYPDCELSDHSVLAALPEWPDIRTLATNPGE